jgi:hypothetical protein
MGDWKNVSDISLTPGDLIEVDRGTYHHWAVYSGSKFPRILSNGSGDNFRKPSHQWMSEIIY